MNPCLFPNDIGPNLLAAILAAIAAVVSIYAAYRTTHSTNALKDAIATLTIGSKGPVNMKEGRS